MKAFEFIVYIDGEIDPQDGTIYAEDPDDAAYMVERDYYRLYDPEDILGIFINAIDTEEPLEELLEYPY